MSSLKERTTNGIAWSGIMSIICQVVGLLFTIIIARKLTPSDYGMVGMLAIFSSLATTIQDGGLVFALANRKEVTNRQYSTIFLLNICFSSFIYLLLFFSAPHIASFFEQPNLLWLSRLIFLGFFFASFGIVQNTYLYKEIKVKERTISTIISLIVSGIIGVTMAYNGFAYWGIACQSVLQVLINTIVLWRLSPFRPSVCFDLSFVKELLPEGFKFLVPNLFAILSENIFSIIIGKKYNVKDVGNYTQALKWNSSGSSVIINVLRNVSQPVLVQVRDDRVSYLAVFRKLFRMTAFLIIPIMLGLAMVAPDFIELILTDKWIESAYILRILCIGGALSVLNTVFSYFIMSLNRTKLYMNLGVLVSLMGLAGAFFSSFFGVLALAYSYFIVSFISFFIYYFFVQQTHPYRASLLISDILPILLSSVAIMLLVYSITSGVELLLYRFILRVLLSFLLYLVLMHIVRYDSYIEAKEYLYKKILRKHYE